MAGTAGGQMYTIAQAAAFVDCEEQTIEAAIASGKLATTEGGILTREALLAFLATYNPRRVALIEIAQDAFNNGEYDITIERLRELSIVTSPDPDEQEDAWAYTPEHRALVARARQDVAEGRVYRLGRSDLERLIAEIERAQSSAQTERP